MGNCLSPRDQTSILETFSRPAYRNVSQVVKSMFGILTDPIDITSEVKLINFILNGLRPFSAEPHKITVPIGDCFIDGVYFEILSSVVAELNNPDHYLYYSEGDTIPINDIGDHKLYTCIRYNPGSNPDAEIGIIHDYNTYFVPNNQILLMLGVIIAEVVEGQIINVNDVVDIDPDFIDICRVYPPGFCDGGWIYPA